MYTNKYMLKELPLEQKWVGRIHSMMRSFLVVFRTKTVHLKLMVIIFADIWLETNVFVKMMDMMLNKWSRAHQGY